MARLGDILVEQGAIARDELEKFAKRYKGKFIGAGLRAHTLIRSRALAMGLASHQGLRLLDPAVMPADASLFEPHNLGHYLKHHYLPYKQDALEPLSEESPLTPPNMPAKAGVGAIIIATPEPSPALKTLLEQYYNQPVEMAVISIRDFTVELAKRGASTLTRRARLSLRRRHKHLTADRVLEKPQIIGLIVLAVILAGAFFLLLT